MDEKPLKTLAAIALIAAAVYLATETGKTPATTTTTTTEAKATTTTMQETPTSSNPYVLPECVQFTNCKRDRCYFGNALNRHEKGLCSQIGDPMLKSNCMEKTGETGLENPVIEGQVFNTRDCGVYPDLQVEVRDETGNITVASMKTSQTGEYGLEVAPGRQYGVYVTVGGNVLNQNMTVSEHMRHIVDFALKPNT